jgi:hypothetical protein
MISALLDHPWPLDAALDENSEGFNVLLKFGELIRAHGMDVVPFITQEELADVWQRVGDGHGRTSGFAALMRFARLFARDAAFHCSATPIPEPSGLTQNWKCALRDAVAGNDWRSPRVVIPEPRRTSWEPGDEITIGFDVCEDLPPSGPYVRVLAFLDTYDSHRFALSDLDPWDLRRVYPPPEDAPAHRRHPCCLPKPPCLDGIAFENLTAKLARARTIGWRIGERRYFIPPANWHPDNRSKQAWRAGQAFERELVPERNSLGYVDYNGIKWIWDEAERHWDVQTDPYLRLGCTGVKL